MSGHANNAARFACLTDNDETGQVAVPAGGAGATLVCDATFGLVLLRNPADSGQTVFIGSAADDDTAGLPLAPGGAENLPIAPGTTLHLHAAGAMNLHFRKVKVG